MFRYTSRLVAATLLLCTSAVAAELPNIRLGALEYGTVNWELDTIKNYGLDEANGFQLEVVPMGGGDASDIAFLGGNIDVMVSDILWAAARHAEGRELKYIPYSTAVGGIMVKSDSGIAGLADLNGKKIGIAGGPLDKNWLIFRAYAQQQGLADLAETSDQEFGAPPVMFKAALSGEVDAVINFWHFQAKAKAAGMTEIISTQEAAESLGLDPTTPLLGYIVNAKLPEQLARALAAASRQAKDILASDASAWEKLEKRMKAKDDAQFQALKAGFIAGIPPQQNVNVEAVNKMFAFMAEVGGEELIGEAKTLPDGLLFD